ncbi:heterodisulfide reductase subunit A [Desulfacinum hydrothermale DSM 13146]|uniref:Heterodisulfide reductase subunit A n=1 Tax=Desulfacinum hydrothermale DSM 13146 TaxID=1121390 RepID=A0A1W1X9N2_9BACT|nr:4Fe-4S binding protein [Desulfacinum hydrothermale]SMC20553.1 heterodisulfide reductase subunit A [Desulfacinum hydrothermale DSM 13146]
MNAPKVILCRCPERHPHVDVARAASVLNASGVPTQVVEHFCDLSTLEGHLHAFRSSPVDVLVGACSGFLLGQVLDLYFQDNPQARWMILDLKQVSDETALAGVVQSHWHSRSGRSQPSCRPPLPNGSGPFPQRFRAKPPQRVVVIGGGVGGCQAALDLAGIGIPVTLVEADLSLGGLMAKLDKTFPTLDCSICILGPRLVDTISHPLITVIPSSRVRRVSGTPGNFLVEIVQQPRHVDMDKCTGCGTCTEVCPVVIPSPWNAGLRPSKAVGIVFEQAVPLRSAIQKDYCIDCGLCEQACERDAIRLTEAPQKRRLNAGAIIVARGAQPLDAARLGPYGYNHYPEVLTNLEFERLVCSTGPTQGRLITPSGHSPAAVAFIQCAGSRNRRYLPYCSGYCCTASIKEAMLVLEHQPSAQVTIFYNDVRATGKNFEGLYVRARQRGIRFIKSLPDRIERGDDGRLRIHYEAPGGEGRQQWSADLAVLAVGLEAAEAQENWVLRRPPHWDRYGFYKEAHHWGGMVAATTPGVFLAGSCHGPRDITQTVTEAGAAAGEAARWLRKTGALAARRKEEAQS